MPNYSYANYCNGSIINIQPIYPQFDGVHTHMVLQTFMRYINTNWFNMLMVCSNYHIAENIFYYYSRRLSLLHCHNSFYICCSKRSTKILYTMFFIMLALAITISLSILAFVIRIIMIEDSQLDHVRIM